ncbi:lipopolysaccharide biosynthesis protein [Haloarcula litorea]|uniref:lipopolysaccharide biosynthesis protein n=1 Tax=Haloarcula litorea TaxID=3032579 RepID=UPI0023E7B537|nr:polysaccharide biosynthesis C-terminal domain-containing protein [Halomicroarcula sp. GDY20]
MRIGYKALVHFGSQVLVSVVGFLATFAIINLGSEALLGEYSTAIALGYFWLVFPAMAVKSGVTKRISEGVDQGEYLGAGIALNVVVGVAAVAAVGALAFTVETLSGGVEVAGRTVTAGGTVFARVVGDHTLLLAALGLGAVVFGTAVAGIEGRKRVGTAGLLTAAERTGRTGVQVAALLAGYGLGALLFGPVVSLFALAVVGFLLLDVRPRLPDRHHFERIVEYVRYAWLGTLRSRVYGWMDTLVLSLFVGASLIGIYEAAWGVASLLSVFSVSIKRTLFPEVSELASDDDIERVRHFLGESLVFGGLVVIPGLFGSLVIGQRVLQFYDPAITRGGGILAILVGAYAVDVYASQFLNVVNAVDRPDIAYRVNAAFIGTNVVLNLVLVWQYGWYGAATATALSASLRTVLGYRGVRTAIGRVGVPLGAIGRQVVAAVVMAAAVLAVNDATPRGRVWTLLLAGGGAAVYFGVLVVLSTRVREKAFSVLPLDYSR